MAHLRALLRLQPRTYASIVLGKQSSQDTHLHSYLHSFRPLRPQPNALVAGSGRAKVYAIEYRRRPIADPTKREELTQ